MNLTRLFHVLVLGGSVIGCQKESRSGALASHDASGDTTTVPTEEDAGSDTTTVSTEDASSDTTTVSTADGGSDTGSDLADTDAGSLDASSSPSDAAVLDASPDRPEVKLGPCFCNSQPCCHRPEAGPPRVEEGFECCWNTTCL